MQTTEKKIGRGKWAKLHLKMGRHCSDGIIERPMKGKQDITLFLPNKAIL